MARYINGIKVRGNTKDLRGEKFGRLTVAKLVGKKHGRLVWECKCGCGNKTEVPTGSLNSGLTKSCGCLCVEAVREANTTHGMSGTREYSAWNNLKARMFNKNHRDYEVNAALGMADVFVRDFMSFLEDIGPIPENAEGRVTVGRIDDTIGYYPGNLCWVKSTTGLRHDNKSGLKGVFKGANRWKATWYDLSGKPRAKSFSIKKYGEELAFFAACECRDVMIQRLNLAGAGYSENHGK